MTPKLYKAYLGKTVMAHVRLARRRAPEKVNRHSPKTWLVVYDNPDTGAVMPFGFAHDASGAGVLCMARLLSWAKNPRVVSAARFGLGAMDDGRARTDAANV